MSLQRSTLCIVRDVNTNDWNAAQNRCYTQRSGASLCTHQQIRRACQNGGFGNPITDTWLGDRLADDIAIVTNISDCNNFDGERGVTANASAQYCCLEWMKY